MIEMPLGGGRLAWAAATANWLNSLHSAFIPLSLDEMSLAEIRSDEMT